jgi:hypothetical protein
MAQYARLRAILPNASKINAFPSRITQYWRVHVTRMAHEQARLFGKRSLNIQHYPARTLRTLKREQHVEITC